MNQIVDELPGSPAAVGTDNPFPGLRPFKVEESHLFFGREGQSDEVLLKLSKSRFVGVIGPSFIAVFYLFSMADSLLMQAPIGRWLLRDLAQVQSITWPNLY